MTALETLASLVKSSTAPWIIVSGPLGRPLVLERRRISAIVKVAKRLRATSRIDAERGAIVLRLAWTRPGHKGGASITHAARLVSPLPDSGQGLVRRPGEKVFERVMWLDVEAFA